MRYRHVLLATDLSPASAVAAAQAKALAAEGAQVDVAHVRAGGSPRVYGYPTAHDLQEERTRLGERLAAWAHEQGLAGARVEVLEGTPSRELARHAERTGADVVVVGATGAGGLRQKLLGSTARHVARASKVDVLVARGPLAARPERLLLATDLEAPSEEAARRAMALVDGTPATVTAVHVVDVDVWRGAAADRAHPPASAALDEKKRAAAPALARFARAHLGGVAAEVVLAGRPQEEIPKLALELNTDLLVVGTHGGGALERALLGSIAEDLVEEAPCSVLVVRA